MVSLLGRCGGRSTKHFTRQLCLVLCVSITSQLICCASAASTNYYIGAGTRKMAERLDRIARTADISQHKFMNAERAEYFREQGQRATNVADVVNYKSQYAMELLNSGQSEKALAEFNRLEEFLKENRLFDLNKTALRISQAVTWLRIGEQENCLTNHTSASCLFPIAAAGIHKMQRGSRGAIQVLTNFLAEVPADLTARWLLNVAYMTVGEYPDNVPRQWLIPPDRFASDSDFKHFTDISANLGLDLEGLAGGVILDDFDGDNHLDLMNSSWGARDPLRYFRNNKDGSFTDLTKEAGLTGESGGLNLIQADYNNDGHLDFFVLRGAWAGSQGRVPNSLMRNNGNGTFDDVTEEAGLLSFHPTQTAAWLDFNNDGWIDLFVGNESSGREMHPCELYRNNGDGTFTECAEQAGIAQIGFVKGVAAGDFDNDGRTDLYLSCMAKLNLLFHNEGPQAASQDPKAPWKFREVGRQAGVREPLYSFPTWFFDYDNDGWLDLFVAGYRLISGVGDIAADYLGLPHQAERVRLYHNNRDGTFADVTKSANLFKVVHAMGSNFGDVDSDGFLDFYIGTGDPDLSTLVPNRMFRNADGRMFQDVTSAGGFGHLQKGHAVAFADLDHDGDQDIYADIGGGFSGDIYRNALFENPGFGNRWIALKLQGVKSNRSAIGARIKVTVQTSNGERAICRVVCSGGSFGASPLRQEIGLGQAQAIKSIEIFWPVTGQTQSFQNIEMNQFLAIQEGSPKPVRLDLKAFKFSSAGMHQHHHHH
jgi:hypothetical protein